MKITLITLLLTVFYIGYGQTYQPEKQTEAITMGDLERYAEWCDFPPDNVLRDTITLCGHTFIPINWSRKEPSIKGFIKWYRSEDNPKSDPKSGFFISPYGTVQSVFDEHEKTISINDTIDTTQQGINE